MIAMSLIFAASVAAQAPAAATQDDLRCVAVVASIIGGQKDQPDPSLFGGLLYFLGRIDARQPGYDVAGNLVTLLSRPDAEAVLKANADRCGNILSERGTFLTTLGDRLQKDLK